MIDALVSLLAQVAVVLVPVVVAYRIIEDL